LLKFGRSGQPHKRFFKVNEDGDNLYYLSRRKKLSDSSSALQQCRFGIVCSSSSRLVTLAVHFADIERIQSGQHTSVFARHSKARVGAHCTPACVLCYCAGVFAPG
jgi:hypothetical protein